MRLWGVPRKFFEKLSEVSEDPASARYESTTKEILTVEPKVHPNPIIPKNTVGAIHGSSTCADHPNPHNPVDVSNFKVSGSGAGGSEPKTVEKATRMIMTSRNSGSNIPPFRRVIQRQMMSDIFPAMALPRIPPMKGARYNKPIDRDDKWYGLN